jgi:uncharacterized protein (DUF885 family)
VITVRLARAVAAGCLACALAASGLVARAESRASAELNRAFDEYWEWSLARNPGFATFVGDARYNDRLGDLSADAVLRERAEAAAFRRRVEAIDPAGLTTEQRVSREVFLRDRASRERLEKFFGELPLRNAYPVTQTFGPQFFLPQMVRSTRFASTADYEAYLKRLAAVPVFLDQVTEQLSLGAAHGWTPPRVTVQAVPAQIGAQVVADPTQSAFYAPFRNFPASVPEAERERLRTAGAAVIKDSVVPAFERFRRYFEGEYLPKTRTELAASTLPGGPAYYDVLLQDQTTTGLTAREIHETGLREVSRVETEMDAVMRSTGFKGSRAEFVRFLWSDPKFFYQTSGELLAGYRDIAKRVDAESPRLFRELPRLPYGIRAMPPERGRAAESYTPGAGDGSRAGYFEANLNDPKGRAKWQMPTLVLHETVPGHHTQSARALELTNIPAFRRFAWYPAFGEGWALYAERLGDEIGMYADPYDRYGHLSGELLRSARMVVDTGLHALGWTREQAVAYMKEHTTESDAFIASEVDRYIVQPGQATTYKVGQLKILELRARATAALGPRFDARRFNNVIIDGGALPLSVVEQNVDRWIAAEKARGG